jgi:hypothetical protein
VILGFDAPRKEDGVQDNPGAKKRQSFSSSFLSVDPQHKVKLGEFRMPSRSLQRYNHEWVGMFLVCR